MRIVPTQVHGVLDYLTGGTLLSAPGLLGPGDVPTSARVPRLAGGGAVLYSLLTLYELGVVKLIPMPFAPRARRRERGVPGVFTLASGLRQRGLALLVAARGSGRRREHLGGGAHYQDQIRAPA
jgi:hypothetical protein